MDKKGCRWAFAHLLGATSCHSEALPKNLNVQPLFFNEFFKFYKIQMSNSMNQYYVYMLSNWNNKVLYVGVTSDLEKRVSQHKLKLYEGFTKKYNVNKLVYYELHRDINYAIAREKQIKGWTRKKKDDLIASINPEWREL